MVHHRYAPGSKSIEFALRVVCLEAAELDKFNLIIS
jgi:hypothetical protein